MKNPAKAIHLEEPTRAQIIDRFGAVYWQIEALQTEYANLKQKINSWFVNHPADQPAIADGYRFSIHLSAQESRRSIFDKYIAFSKLRKLLGLKETVELLTIPLGAAVDKFIPEPQHAEFLKRDRTGPRTLTPVPRQDTVDLPAPPKVLA